MMRLSYLVFCCLLHIGLSAHTSELPEKSKVNLYLASGFSEVWDDIVNLLPVKPEESIACHVTTAAFNADWTKNLSERIKKSGFTVKRLDIAKYDEATFSVAFNNCDIIYVGGGDEFYLLQEFRRTGFDKFILEKIHQGLPYIGTSAGSMVLGSSIEFSKSIRDPKASPLLKSYEGLNVIPFSLFVHFDNPDLKEIYRTILDFAWQDSTSFLTLHDNQFLFVEGHQWRIVESNK